MEKRRKEFILDSQGHCFLCLRGTNGELESLVDSTIHPVQSLLRYLKLDLKAVLKKNGVNEVTIPSLLPTNEKKTILKVELCGECGYLNKTFSELNTKIEKIEIERAHCLKRIQRKLLISKLGGSKVNLVDQSIGKLASQYEIMEALRMEATQKCFQRLTSALPRVKVQNLNRRNVSSLMKRIPNSKTINSGLKKEIFCGPNSNNETISNPEIEIGPVKVQLPDTDFVSDFDESEDALHSTSEWDDFNAAALTTDRDTQEGVQKLTTTTKRRVQRQTRREEDIGKMMGKSKSNNTSQTKLKTKNKEGSPKLEESCEDLKVPRKGSRRKRPRVIDSNSPIKGMQGRPNNSENSETGKYKCRVCPLKFNTRNKLIYHRRIVHNKNKFKCQVCGVQFNSKMSQNRHYQNVHLKIRHNCPLCDQKFTQRYSLYRHHRDVHTSTQKNKFKCNGCNHLFGRASNLARHLRDTKCGGR